MLIEEKNHIQTITAFKHEKDFTDSFNGFYVHR